MSTKIDLKKELKKIYSASVKVPKFVHVPKMNYLSIEGKGDPNSSKEYMDAIQTLFSVAYTIKFMSKKELKKDYTVMPLETLWWVKDTKNFSLENKSNWLWQALIMLPKFITRDILTQAVSEVQKKKKLPSLPKLRWETLSEGLAAQILHIGSYADEKPTIEKLHAFIKEQGYTFDGTKQKHHEIYFSDPKRVAPEKLKTIIRQPVTK